LTVLKPSILLLNPTSKLNEIELNPTSKLNEIELNQKSKLNKIELKLNPDVELS
jgi:hypothetical protein